MSTQSQLYERLKEVDLDPELSWSEAELPERLRTKHVHRLHPYLGKFVPQLVEIFLHRHFEPGHWVLDPFAGSGTTLVECSTFGVNSIGIDISAFNVLLTRVKTATYEPRVVEHDLHDALARLTRFVDGSTGQLSLETDVDEPATQAPTSSEFLREWYDVRALTELLFYRSLRGNYESDDLMGIVLSRAAHSARLTTHSVLDFLKKPQTEPYECAKHRKICHPTREAYRFLRRHTLDAIERVNQYARLRSDAEAIVLHGDGRNAEFGATFDGLITSPPYPGRIDYHEQHRYAYELLGLEDRRSDEIGAAEKGKSKTAVAAYVTDMIAVLDNARRQLRPGAPVIIVIDDSRNLYDEILREAGLTIDERRRRHVNRRTGRRGDEFFEQIILART